MPRGDRTTPTPQQRRAIGLFKENMLTNGTRSFEDILLDAGYSPKSARQQSNIMAGIKPHLADFIEEMKEHRDVVMERMKTAVRTADYAALARAVDVLSRNIQLLGGKPSPSLHVRSPSPSPSTGKTHS
jgi:hypothetical protein